MLLNIITDGPDPEPRAPRQPRESRKRAHAQAGKGARPAPAADHPPAKRGKLGGSAARGSARPAAVKTVDAKASDVAARSPAASSSTAGAEAASATARPNSGRKANPGRNSPTTPSGAAKVSSQASSTAKPQKTFQAKAANAAAKPVSNNSDPPLMAVAEPTPSLKVGSRQGGPKTPSASGAAKPAAAKQAAGKPTRAQQTSSKNTPAAQATGPSARVARSRAAETNGTAPSGATEGTAKVQAGTASSSSSAAPACAAAKPQVKPSQHERAPAAGKDQADKTAKKTKAPATKPRPKSSPAPSVSISNPDAKTSHSASKPAANKAAGGGKQAAPKNAEELKSRAAAQASGPKRAGATSAKMVSTAQAKSTAAKRSTGAPGAKAGGKVSNKRADATTEVAPAESPSNDAAPEDQAAETGFSAAAEHIIATDARENFTSLALDAKIVDVLERADETGGFAFTQPTVVQSWTIPPILEGRDVLVRSETGSGKTLAFGLPILQGLLTNGKVTRSDGISALILSPTRELCFQITQVLEKLCKPFFWLVIGALSGGEKRKSEKARLRKGLNILVATPGRLLDHLEHTETLGQGLSRGQLRWLVLDEADRLTDPGFVKQIGQVLDWLEQNGCATGGNLNSKRLQTIMVSATLNSKVQELASRSLHEPVVIEAKSLRTTRPKPEPTGNDANGEAHGDAEEDGANDEAEATMETEEGKMTMPKTLTQHFMIVESKDRLVALSSFILRQVKRYRYAVKIILFVSCRAVVDFLFAAMNQLEWPPRRQLSGSKAQNQGLGTRWFKLHGSVEQKERRRAINDFSKAKNGVLICTDVAARGLDLPSVDWIIQYDPPTEFSEYVHRVGRTARSGRRGSSLLFLAPFEEEYVKLLEARNAKLVEMKTENVFAALSKYASEQDEGADQDDQSGHVADKPGSKKRKGRPDDAILERARRSPEAAAALLHLKIRDLVEGAAEDEEAAAKRPKLGGGKVNKLKVLAEEAFVAYVRAYAVHSKETKPIFHPKKLHLGHVARSFGLKEEPKGVSSTSRSRYKERVKKKEGHKRKRDFERAAKKLTRRMDI